MINIPSTVKISLKALMGNKMRSILTMLGIIIGVGAVITMLAVGNGAQEQISAQIASMGSNLLMVLPGASTSGGVRMGMGTQLTLTYNDVEGIRKEISSVQAAAPILNGVAQIVYGNQNWSTGVVGTTPSMLEVRDWGVALGRPFTEEDVRNSSKVALLGITVVNNLFRNINPIGQMVRIKNIPFTVIGILEEKGQSPNGQDQDDTIYIPVTTAQKKLFGTLFPGMIRIAMVKAKSPEDLPVAEKQIAEYLRQKHHIGPRQEDDFSVRNLTQMMQAAEQSTRIMTLLLGSVASISLVVGGIGIMNIMLVSVTERTREIGIRMAVGAQTWDIRLQFLIEALCLSLAGGIIGILLGVSGSALIASFAGWSTTISPIAILISFSFSGLVGIFFGYYPAYKASLLSPIEALRHE
ncbi:MAG: ABC transporter permease [Nitrospiria bacterium]